MRLSDLARAAGLDAALPDLEISGANTLAAAGPSEIAFFSNPKYRDELKATRAGAVLLGERERDKLNPAAVAVVCADPYAAFAKILTLLHPASDALPGVHPSAHVDATASVAKSAHIGANAVIGANAQIGEGAVIGPGCVIGGDVSIGQGSKLFANVTVYHDCQIGQRCILHSGVVIGADGFGFAPTRQGLLKIPQVGSVRIGNDVEIGANSTVDRGALGDTTIGDGVKLDNQIQIGHNVEIGPHTVIAAMTGIAGSAKIGARCMIGGQVGINGHITIGDDCQIAGRAGVVRDLPPKSRVGGFPAIPQNQWLRLTAALDKLPELVRKRSD